ncbi:MAG TPA: hypothetical protein VEX68_06075 [Bryobacteraceae bacterium]|nr:hypothetical protein [Bryobacteraceae bacterium]
MLARQILFGRLSGLHRVGLIRDVVPLEDASSPVPGNLHDYGLG